MIGTGDVGNGTLFGTNADGGNTVFAKWDKLTPFFEGGYSPGEDRIFFGAGESDCGASGNLGTMSAYNLNANGERIFLNIVKEYAGEYVNDIPEFTNSFAASLKLYPNPATNRLNISFVSEISGYAYLSIVDITGKNVYSGLQAISMGRNNVTLDVSSLAKGAYMITVTIEDDVQVTRKLTIQ